MKTKLSSEMNANSAPELPTITSLPPISLFGDLPQNKRRSSVPSRTARNDPAGSQFSWVPLPPAEERKPPILRKPVPESARDFKSVRNFDPTVAAPASPAVRPADTGKFRKVWHGSKKFFLDRKPGLSCSPETKEKARKIMDAIKDYDFIEEAADILCMMVIKPRSSRSRGANETSGGYFNNSNYDDDGDGPFGRR